MKSRLITGLLLASSALLAAPRIAIGVGIGVPVARNYYVAPAPAYVPPPVYAPAPVYVPARAYVAPAYVPPRPGPGYRWIAGYWYVAGGRRVWRAGYWAAPRAWAHPAVNMADAKMVAPIDAAAILEV